MPPTERIVSPNFSAETKVPLAGEFSRAPVQTSVSQAVSFLPWLAVGIFVLSNFLNFLDRQLLAAVAPTLKEEFHLANVQYGTLVSAFSLIYAFMTPLAGLFVDRVGLNTGVTAAVSVWSLGGIATGVVRTFRGLIASRAVLGLGEAASLPFLSKANATYLKPSEWGLASAAGSLAVTGGSIAAPLLVASLSPRFGWRSVFVFSGLMGFVWAAIWLFTSKRIPAAEHTRVRTQTVPVRTMLADRRFWRVILAYGLVMTVFVLWLNWTTLYLVQQHHLSQTAANQSFAWFPPVCAALGGFFNGWLAFRWIRRGADPTAARIRICVMLAPLFLVSAAIPLLPTPRLAILAIGVALFACQSVVGSLNILPIDFFGPGRAAFGISLLGCSYSLMQTFLSPLIGASVDRFGFRGICVVAAVIPLLGIWVLRRVR